MICFVFIFRHNFYQRTVIFNSSNSISGSILKTVNSVQDYLYLKEINQQLLEENALLKSMHKSSFIISDRNILIENDSLFQRKFSYIPAKVVNNTVNRVNNYLTLNIGRNQNIEPGMGVISPTGVVGIVKDVSDNFASVYSVLHSDIKISGKLGTEEIIGTVIWPGKHYKYASLTDIARYHAIEKGDTVYTSGYSQIFPQGIPIGYIDSFSVNKAYDFYEIMIELATDFSKVNQVYVIVNHSYKEQSALEEDTQNE